MKVKGTLMYHTRLPLHAYQTDKISQGTEKNEEDVKEDEKEENSSRKVEARSENGSQPCSRGLVAY